MGNSREMETTEVNETRRNAIRFYHRGEIVEISDVEPTRTLLEWLRESAGCCGTKEGCAEGDCGACTVLIAELPDDDAKEAVNRNIVGEISLRPVNACIKFLPTLDGCGIITVEDLEGFAGAKRTDAPSEKLHPVQQAMVDCHGSQCGFCTPGFVMSLTATYERHCEAGTRPTRGEVSDDIAGNLCRCTGYRPILDAASRMFDLPKVRIDTAPIAAALRELRKTPMEFYENSAQKFWSPRNLQSFSAIRAAEPQARLLSGSTDIGLWVNKQMRDIGNILYIGGVSELKRVEEEDGSLAIGAAVPLEDAWPAVVARWPHLRDIWLRFASPPVRQVGTLGGNLANGSPIGDGAPIFMALGSSIVLRHGETTRELALKDFYLDYMKNAMRPGEFLQAIRVPLPTSRQLVRAYKVSKRFDSDISSVCAAFALEFDENKIVQSAKFCFGGMAATVKHAAGAEAAVAGTAWDENALRSAQWAIDSDFTPLTDLRGSADYRKIVVRGLLERFWLETGAGGAPILGSAETSVFASIQH